MICYVHFVHCTVYIVQCSVYVYSLYSDVNVLLLQSHHFFFVSNISKIRKARFLLRKLSSILDYRVVPIVFFPEGHNEKVREVSTFDHNCGRRKYKYQKI